MTLRQKPHRAGGKRHRVSIVGKGNRGPCLLHRHIPAKKCSFASSKRSKNGWRHSVSVREIHHGDEGFHLDPDRQANASPRGAHSIGCCGKHARHFGRSHTRLPINGACDGITDDRLSDLAFYAAERGDRVRKRQGRCSDGILRGDVSGSDERVRQMSRTFSVLKTDAVDINISRQDIGGRFKTDLPSKSDILVLVVAGDKDKRVLISKARDWRRRPSPVTPMPPTR